MMKAVGMGVVFGGLAMLLGCARTPPSPPRGADATARGREVYLRRCASCHGIDGRGNGPVAASLRAAPPDLTGLGARNEGSFPSVRVESTVTGATDIPAHGSREMPVWSQQLGPRSGATTAAGMWSATQLDQLLAYLESIQSR